MQSLISSYLILHISKHSYHPHWIGQKVITFYNWFASTLIKRNPVVAVNTLLFKPTGTWDGGLCSNSAPQCPENLSPVLGKCLGTNEKGCNAYVTWYCSDCPSGKTVNHIWGVTLFTKCDEMFVKTYYIMNQNNLVCFLLDCGLLLNWHNTKQ